jgi:hypothetical protein
MKNYAITRQHVECSKLFQRNQSPKVIHEFSAPGIDQAKDEFFKFMAIEYFEHENNIFDGAGNEIMAHGDSSADDGSYIFEVVEIN